MIRAGVLVVVVAVFCAAAFGGVARAEREGLAAQSRFSWYCLFENSPMNSQGELKQPDSFWKDLALFAPDKSKYSGFGHYLQTISDCEKCGVNVAYDYYPVHVEKLPTNAAGDPGLLLSAVAADLALWDKTTILDQRYTQFQPWDKDNSDKWASENPADRVGTWFHLNIPAKAGTFGSSVVSDQAAVVCTRFENSSTHGNWVFSTALTISDQYHPVTGHREFGYKKAGVGKVGFIYYTRGIDRLTGCLSQYADAAGQVKPAQIKLWRSLQQGIANYVNKHGGKASVPGFYSTEKNFQQYWKQFTVQCFRHNGAHVYKLPEATDACERTTIGSCSADGECKPKAGKRCGGKCACGDDGVNECFCVKDVASSGRACDPWNIQDL